MTFNMHLVCDCLLSDRSQKEAVHVCFSFILVAQKVFPSFNYHSENPGISIQQGITSSLEGAFLQEQNVAINIIDSNIVFDRLLTR
jgi:hypothetical protein